LFFGTPLNTNAYTPHIYTDVACSGCKVSHSQNLGALFEDQQTFMKKKAADFYEKKATMSLN